MPSRIEDYALIGDCQTAALVARDGSIDWLCLPRFDSGGLLRRAAGRAGAWPLAARPGRRGRAGRRRYRDGTLVLETEFETDDGVVAVIDCMPPRGTRPDLVRSSRGVAGAVPMRMELIIRFDYGSIVPWVRRRDGRHPRHRRARRRSGPRPTCRSGARELDDRRRRSRLEAAERCRSS